MAYGSRGRSRGARACGAALAVSLSLVAQGSLHAADPPRPAATSAPSASPTSAPSTSATAAPVNPAKDNRDRQARAVELHDEAKALYERGLYRRAIAKLEAAVELDPEGKELVYNLALIHEKLVEPDIAERYYRRYIEMETDPAARERTQAIVKRLEAAKKNLKADLQERAAAMSAGGSASPSGPAVPGAAPVSRMPSPMVFVLGGVALAAAGVGIGFGVSAITTHPDGETTGPRTTSYDLQARAEAAHTHAVVADLSFVTSLVVGAATAVLYLLETRTPRPAPAAAPASASRTRLEVPF